MRTALGSGIRIGIFIVAEDTAARFDIGLLLEREDTFQIVGHAGSGEKAIDKCRQLRPDVVIVDMETPGLTAFDVMCGVKREHPTAKLIVLSMYDDQDHFLSGLRAGGDGYVVKDAAPRELVAAIRVSLDDGSHVSSRVLRKFSEHVISTRPPERSVIVQGLRQQERELWKLLAEGTDVHEISRKLKVPTRAVNTLKRGLMEKLNILNCAQLVEYAIIYNIIKLPAIRSDTDS